MLTFGAEDHVKNNCTECEHFSSYYDDYGGNDEYEPKDQGFCREGQNDGYGDATITCELFEPIRGL